MECMAKFTIVTPVLNGADFIEGCILSVAAQNVSVQHIVMDGGSTDGTQEILQRHGHLLAHWESTPDLGQSDAINKGLAMADGKYFNWLNADDTLCPDALQTVSALMAPDTDVVVGGCAHISPSGETLTVGGTLVHPTLEQTLGRYSMGQPSHFYRTATVKKLGGLNPALHFAMDMELWFRYLLRHGQHRVVSTDLILSHFLVHPAAKSVAHDQQMFSEKWAIYRSLLSSAEKPAPIERWFDDHASGLSVTLAQEHELNHTALLGHFALPLMPDAYMNRDAELLRALLRSVAVAGILSPAERILWELRLLKSHLAG